MKILIAPNSFKECADSVTISKLIAKEFKVPGDFNLVIKPVSDGGDGFLSVCKENFNLDILSYKISTPFDDSKFNCEVGYDSLKEIVYIESANVLGLKVIPKEKRNPLFLNSKGMGDLIKQIIADYQRGKLKIKKLIIGVGGTGINDLGFGLFAEFGLTVHDQTSRLLEMIPLNFANAKTINWSKYELPFKLEVIVDVDNELLGKNGATRVFGKQKGLDTEGIKIVEKGFSKIINSLKNKRLSYPLKNLSGAGGGLAAGLQIFFNAKVIKSSSFILDALEIRKVKDVDLVITGEGAFDEQSFMEKATGSLIKYFTQKGTKVIVCCGIFDKKLKKVLPNCVEIIELSRYFKSVEESIRNFRKGIRLASKEIKNKLKQ